MMKAIDLLVGDSFPLVGDCLGVVTEIQDSLCSDKPKRTIVFDIFSTGLFPEKIGWSWYVFFDVNTYLNLFLKKNKLPYEKV